MTNGGYDQTEMPKVFRTLDRVSSAGGGSRLPSWLSTHPDPGNRATRISEQVAALPSQMRGSKISRDSYLQRLEGLTFGANPREGYFLENRFYHPEMEFQLRFPAGWKTQNHRSSVGAFSPSEDAIVVLSLAEESNVSEAESAFFAEERVIRGREYRSGYSYFSVESTSTETTTSSEVPQIAGIAGFVSHAGSVLRILGFCSGATWEGYESSLLESATSFARLSDRRYLDVQPKHIEVVRIDRNMSFEEFAQRFPSAIELDALAILNGLAVGASLDNGQLVKRVVGGNLPER